MTFAITSDPVALPPVRLIGWFGISSYLTYLFMTSTQREQRAQSV